MHSRPRAQRLSAECAASCVVLVPKEECNCEQLHFVERGKQTRCGNALLSSTRCAMITNYAGGIFKDAPQPSQPLLSESSFQIHFELSARHYESCKNIEGLAPPRCPFRAGTTVVQIISKGRFCCWIFEKNILGTGF